MDLSLLKQTYGIIGSYPKLIEALEKAVKYAEFDNSILVLGESGVGKDVFARLIHGCSNRKSKKLVSVDCGAMNEGTINSELFGHERGAFTDAVSDKKGYFEVADGGTIFLDEIGNMPMETQMRLLRVLQNGTFMRVGSSAEIKTNVRIIAATNVDLRKAVASGKFRQDLFYRLNQGKIQVPPLRDRGNDIVLLAHKFASEFFHTYNRSNRITFEKAADEALLAYKWPGNVRELKSVISTVCMLNSNESIITKEMLSEHLNPGDFQLTTIDDGASFTYSIDREQLFHHIKMLMEQVASLTSRVVNLEQGIGNIPNAPYPATNLLPPTNEQTATPTLEHEIQVPTVVEEHEVPPMELPTHEATDADFEEVHGGELIIKPGLTMDKINDLVYESVLRRHNGNRKNAADELQVSVRTLYRWIEKTNFKI